MTYQNPTIIDQKTAKFSFAKIFWLIALSVGTLGGVLCITIIGLPVGIPLILVAGVLGIVAIVVSVIEAIINLALYAKEKHDKNL